MKTVKLHLPVSDGVCHLELCCSPPCCGSIRASLSHYDQVASWCGGTLLAAQDFIPVCTGLGGHSFTCTESSSLVIAQWPIAQP